MTFFVRMCELNYSQMSYLTMWELYLHMKMFALCASFVTFGSLFLKTFPSLPTAIKRSPLISCFVLVV
jgi:hypothetical protein